MKIGIVAPSPVPFTIGGVENVLWGLCDTINQETNHQAEIIKLPSREYDFWSLIDNYHAFYNLDLSYFDCVITTKYPSWMIRHTNSICYMIHTLRGLYDTYHFMGQPTEVKRGCKKIDKILDYMNASSRRENLDEFFAMLFELRENHADVPDEYFQFPAPFIRALVHYMDQWALSRDSVKKFYSISDTIRKRTDYFPPDADVEVVYPPSNLKKFSSGDYKYVFMISRLDSPKRIDMLVRAMKYVRSDVRLLIAGTGPQADELHRLAEGDERIQFLGFVNDEDAERYYADSLVIPYFPYDEDYGLITIEAMMHRKPVITTFDAGGPTEFVVDGETGFVTMFEEKAIAEKIDYFAEHPEKAREMGENAYNRVKNITWENTVMALLQGCDAKTVIEKKTEEDANRKKIVLTSTFSIYPPQGGGQARTYDLYKNVAEAYDVQIVSFGAVNEQASEQKIAGHMIETKIPKTEKHQREESEIEKKVGIPITDIAMFRLAGLTPEYGRKLKAAIETSDIVVCSHPYLYPEVKKYLGDKPFIYEAQDVEYEIKKGMLPKNDTSEKMLKQIYEVEKECCEKSQFILTCSEEDKIKLHELYGVPLDKILPVANGVDCKNTRYTNVQARLRNKERMGLSNEKMALFMGSWHGPNLESCEEIIRMAPQCPDVKFLLMGSQCGYFKGRQLPENIGMLGVVDEETKNRVFATVDFALNPMLSGSGTNLKMFDYMAAGLPVITTRFGTRGIEEKEHFTIAEVDEMPEAVRQFSLKDHAKTVEDARKYMENTFDWKVIAEAYIKRISGIL